MKTTISSLCLFLLMFGCKKPEPLPVLPSLYIPPIIAVTDELANIRCEINVEGDALITERGLCWSASNALPTTTDNKVEYLDRIWAYYIELPSLKPETEYYVRAYVVNKYGTTYSAPRTFKTKASWAKINSGTVNNLTCVFFADSFTGYAAGANGTILKTTDAGLTWSQQASGTTKQLNDIYFYDKLVGNVVGNGLILHTKDGGQTWKECNSTNAGNLKCINYENQSTGFAGGDKVLYYTSFGGSQWDSRSSTSDIIGVGFDYHLQFLVASNGDFTYIQWFGPTNTNKYTGTAGSVFNSFFIGYAYSQRKGFLVGNNGNIKLTKNLGSSWSDISSGTSNHLYKIAFNNDFINGFIVGQAGTILTSFDAGEKWFSIKSGVISVLRGAALSKAGITIAVGDGGTILRYKY